MKNFDAATVFILPKKMAYAEALVKLQSCGYSMQKQKQFRFQ